MAFADKQHHSKKKVLTNGSHSGTLVENQMEELRAAFAFFDRNGNGCIEAEELGAVMVSLGYQATESELRDMINEADADGNKMIDFEEFVLMMESKSRPGQDDEEEMKEAFKASITVFVLRKQNIVMNC